MRMVQNNKRSAVSKPPCNIFVWSFVIVLVLVRRLDVFSITRTTTISEQEVARSSIAGAIHPGYE
jgi:hypothetical protein